MKFCYADESGVGSEVTVIAGVVIDAQRMNRAKIDWDELLDDVRGSVEGNFLELKGRHLYRGNQVWRELDGGERTKFIEQIIQWMVKKKHHLTFGAVLKDNLNTARKGFDLDGFETKDQWSIAAMHLVLGIQKTYQGQKSNKGNTVFVFDDAKSKGTFSALVLDPPPATDGFYKRARKQERLDQVIDVPYFVDSKDVSLIQLADLFAFLIRLFAELKDGITEEKFPGETSRLEGWMADMSPFLLKDSARWPTSSRDPCTKFLREIAPPSLLKMAS